MASYERELNDILERHKMDMKSLELSCMTTRQDLERSEWYTSLIVWLLVEDSPKEYCQITEAVKLPNAFSQSCGPSKQWICMFPNYCIEAHMHDENTHNSSFLSVCTV